MENSGLVRSTIMDQDLVILEASEVIYVAHYLESNMEDKQAYYKSTEFELRQEKEKKDMEMEIRGIVHRRIWLGRGSCQISVRRVVRLAGEKAGLKRAQLRMYYSMCCKIIEDIGGRIDGITRRHWSNGQREKVDWDHVKYKLSERVYLYEGQVTKADAGDRKV